MLDKKTSESMKTINRHCLERLVRRQHILQCPILQSTTNRSATPAGMSKMDSQSGIFVNECASHRPSAVQTNHATTTTGCEKNDLPSGCAFPQCGQTSAFG